jgi:RNA polymerase sigma-70 factor (ECF subfamily)
MHAYKELYFLLCDGLHRFSYSLVKSNEVAEEIVSDVFIKIWQIRNQLDQIDNLKVYLYTIARNFSLNYITKSFKHPTGELDEIDAETIIEFTNPEDLYISNETIREIKGTIQQLPPKCRTIFQLVREEGLTYKEVASILNVSVLTVRNQIAIATKKIADILTTQKLKYIKEANLN